MKVVSIVILIFLVVLIVYIKHGNTIVIKRAGRFGNNVVQVRNMINLALQHGVTGIKHASHDKVYKLPKKTKNTMPLWKLYIIRCLPNASFWYNQNYPLYFRWMFPDFNVDATNNVELTELVRDYYKDQFNFKYAPHDRDDLVIHVRSGDLYTKHWPQNTYVQPPYEYYKNIIMSKDWDNIAVISEDDFKSYCT